MGQRRRATSNGRATGPPGPPATDGGSRSLWFDPPTDDQDSRPRLTRERVVAEALAVIAEDGVHALTMRSLAARLGVVPAAVYRHVRSKQQLQDLLLDGVLAEIDFDLDPSLKWSEQLKVRAHRLRRVLEQHPGVAGILRTRDPSDLTPWPWPRRSLRRCRPPGSVTAKPAWPSSCWSTTPSALPSAAPPPPSTSSASATQRPEANCTSSSAHPPRTDFPPWSPWANTSGSTTGTSGSPPASTHLSPGLKLPVSDRRPVEARPLRADTAARPAHAVTARPSTGTPGGLFHAICTFASTAAVTAVTVSATIARRIPHARAER
jgi:hypothetical protein